MRVGYTESIVTSYSSCLLFVWWQQWKYSWCRRGNGGEQPSATMQEDLLFLCHSLSLSLYIYKYIFDDNNASSLNHHRVASGYGWFLPPANSLTTTWLLTIAVITVFEHTLSSSAIPSDLSSYNKGWHLQLPYYPN